MSVLVLPLPGPDHLPQPLAVASRAALVGRPRAALAASLARLQTLAGNGERVVVLPPLALPDPIARELLGGSEEMVGLAHLPDPLGIVREGLALRGSDGKVRFLVANRGSCNAGVLSAWARTRRWRLLLGDAVLPALPAAPALADEGAVNHLLLVDGERHLHLWGHDRAADMPRRFRGRGGGSQNREAQAAAIRLGRLERGHSLLARRHWKGVEAGASGLRHLACTGPGFLALHEYALGEQHTALQVVGQRLPGFAVTVVRDRALRLRTAVASGALLGLCGATGTWFASAAAIAASRALLGELQGRGLIEAVVTDPADDLPPAGLAVGTLSLGPAEATALPPGLAADRAETAIEALLPQWPEQVTTSDLLDPDHARRCHGLRAELATRLDCCPEETYGTP